MQPLSVKRGTDSQQRLVSLLAEDIKAEAQQFWQCAAIHEARGNESAAAVGRRAHEMLTRFAAAVKQANAGTERRGRPMTSELATDVARPRSLQ